MAYFNPSAETTARGAPDLNLVGPAPNELRVVNLLTGTQIHDLVSRWMASGAIKPITCRCGGGDGVARHPDLNTYYTHLVGTRGAGEGSVVQITVPVASSAYARLRPFISSPQIKVAAHLVWHRYQWIQNHADQNRRRDWIDDCPLLPLNVEMAHLAPAYAGTRASNGERITQVLETVACTSEMNESMKPCARYGLMWRKAIGGAVIQPEERDTYVGPTSCFHGHIPGHFSCYGPPPEPDLSTPTKKRVRSPKLVTGHTAERVDRFAGRKGGGGRGGGRGKKLKT